MLRAWVVERDLRQRVGDGETGQQVLARMTAAYQQIAGSPSGRDRRPRRLRRQPHPRPEFTLRPGLPRLGAPAPARRRLPRGVDRPRLALPDMARPGRTALRHSIRSRSTTNTRSTDLDDYSNRDETATTCNQVAPVPTRVLAQPEHVRRVATRCLLWS